jgi:hypothetical protein
VQIFNIFVDYESVLCVYACVCVGYPCFGVGVGCFFHVSSCANSVSWMFLLHRIYTLYFYTHMSPKSTSLSLGYRNIYTAPSRKLRTPNRNQDIGKFQGASDAVITNLTWRLTAQISTSFLEIPSFSVLLIFLKTLDWKHLRKKLYARNSKVISGWCESVLLKIIILDRGIENIYFAFCTFNFRCTLIVHL